MHRNPSSRLPWRCLAWLLPLLFCLAGPPALAACDPSISCCAESIPSGSPCGGAGVASQGNASGTDQGAGNPINLVSGNKYQQEVDLPPLPGVMGLEIIRHYNSSRSGTEVKVGGLGRGWKLSYETQLFRLRGNVLEIVQADGTRLLFERDFQGREIWTGATSMQGKINSLLKEAGLPYTWVWPDGRQLDFNTRGKLVQIRAATGEAVQLQYDLDGGLEQVTDPQGRSLHLNHLPRKLWGRGKRFRGVLSIDSPVGRFNYHHGSPMPANSTADRNSLIANLVRVDYPAGHDAKSSISRHYHYEDPHYPTLLTGISVEGTGSDGRAMKQRLSTWQYDQYGRAILSVKGEPARWEEKDGKRQLVAGTGIEQVSLHWPRRGEVLLTNSLGQQTRYKTARIAGQTRILEARGAGCASCGPVNMRYAYDHLGLLQEETRLDATGQPLLSTRTGYDGHGRPREVSTIAWIKGKPQAPRWTMSLRYPPHDARLDPQGVPPSYTAYISRPSVVAGKVHELSIRYNAQGQPLEIVESGWRPALAPEGEAVPISRSTRFGYQMLDARSLLSEIDGPLANGPQGSPADSDITRLQWGPQGRYIIAMTTPGGTRSQIEYDAAGRVQQLANNHNQRSGFAWTALGQLERIHHSGAQRLPLQQQLRHDALGRNTEVGDTDLDSGQYRARLKLEFDAAGRTAWQASALGMLQSFRHDSESRLIEASLGNSAMARVRQWKYDAAGRIIAVHDNSGATTRIRYDARGFPLEMSDALGRRQPLAKSTGSPAGTRSIPTRQLKDDFGRIVATLSPDSGATLREFDAADRLISSRDARGNRARYEYDLHGRILRQTIWERSAEGKDLPPSVSAWRYEGAKLVAVEHPTQDERYHHDQRGLLSSKQVSLPQPGGKRITSITRYLYNDDGLLKAVSLPDGSLIEYERNGQNQVVSVRRQRLQSAWLRWLLPRQILVDQLERDLVGLRHARNGNGIQTGIQRSAQAVLARKLHGPQSAFVQGDALAWLIRHARASQPTDAAPPLFPGALGMPSDPSALLDWRYLWDAQGNLLHLRQVAGTPRLGNYAYDRHDRLAIAVHSQGKQVEASRYFHDRQGRRLLAQEDIADQSDLKTHSEKSLYQPGTHRWLGAEGKTAAYDASGLPQSIGQRSYAWDALGRLRSVKQNGKHLASYAYNHRGERIFKQTDKATQFLHQDGQLQAELDGQGLIRRQYVYLADMPLVVIDSSKGQTPESKERGFFSRMQRDLKTVFRAWLSNDERMVWLHTNHLGAVEAATDKSGKPVWRATWQASGRLNITSQSFALQLRLPGQYEDEETGLYYNRHRYYDPRRGAYLTPDPLGRPDGPNPYAYVRGNPLRYIDPSGLVLFAFDGTENSNPVMNPGAGTLSNVIEFIELYYEATFRYISGVGTIDRSDPSRPIEAPFLDAGVNWSGPERIARMVEYLGDEADLVNDAEAMDVDIIGFSRGAAQSRDFANRIVANTRMIAGTSSGWYSYFDSQSNESRCQLIRFRFMGLFDTVLSTNWSGYSYNLSIPAAFEYVAHAVAVNEYRGHVLPLGRANVTSPHSWGAFPLESIVTDSAPTGRTRIELGFIGAHADIGGGFQDNALSLVALAWMVEQARRAGVMMRPVPINIESDPVLHDKSDAIRFGSPTSGSQLSNDGDWNKDYSISANAKPGGGAEDRAVHYADRTRNTTQRNMINIGLSYAESEKFIVYDLQRSRSDNVTGTVDVANYVAWLQANGYELGNISVRQP